MFKKDPVKYKQPQELFCSNYECLNEIASKSHLSYLLTDEAERIFSDFYCLDCIIEGKAK